MLTGTKPRERVQRLTFQANSDSYDGNRGQVEFEFDGDHLKVSRPNKNYDASATPQYIEFTMPTITDKASPAASSITSIVPVMSRYNGWTLNATNTGVVYHHAATLNVLAPVGGNVSLLNPWAIWSDGRVNIDQSDDVSRDSGGDGSFHTGGGISADKGIRTGTRFLFGGNQTTYTDAESIWRQSDGNTLHLGSRGRVKVHIDIDNNESDRSFAIDTNNGTNLLVVSEDGTVQLRTLTDATRPSPGGAGRIIYNSDDGNINIDNGTNWILPDGTVT